MFKILDIIENAVKKKTSDVHISVDSEILFRINGNLEKVTDFKLTNDDVKDIINEITEPIQREQIETGKELDYAITVGSARLRVNVFLQQKKPAIAIRILPSKIPTVEELKTPKSIVDLVTLKKGLVLITGSTGSGKSTTLAALINYINDNFNRHVITLEDPIEYIHSNKKSFIQQREIGNDTKTFASGVRASLREDPDVILIGEMRDPETTSIALTAAETGHLVFATVHANSAPMTIDRIIDSFPSDTQNQIRIQMSNTLMGTVSQMLLPAVSGGRVPAYEIMIPDNAIRNLIREKKTFQLTSSIDAGKMSGMITMDKYIMALLKEGKIDKETALQNLSNKDILRQTGGY